MVHLSKGLVGAAQVMTIKVGGRITDPFRMVRGDKGFTLNELKESVRV